MVVINQISYWVYFPIFKLVEVYLKKRHKKISAISLRGGVAHKYCIFPLSDIDTTIVVSDYSEIVRLRTDLLRVKKWIPFFSEVNVFSDCDIEKFINSFNSYEIRRDPYFARDFFEINLKVNEDAFVFAARLWQANLDKKEKIRRAKKWAYYASVLNWPVVTTKSDFLNQLESLYSKLTNNPSTNFRIRYDRYLTTGLDPVINLSKWLEQSFATSCFEEQLHSLKSYSKEDKKIVLSHIKWEIMGLVSQLYLISKNNSYVEHCNNLKRVLLVIDEDEVEVFDVKRSLENLITRNIELQSL